MSRAYASEAYALMNTPIETRRHLKRVLRLLAPEPGDRILEVGCGRGFLLRELQALCPRATGIDVNPEAIRHSVARGARQMGLDPMAFGDASFDLLYSLHTLEHLADPTASLSEMARVLRRGGRLLLVYPAEPVRGLFSAPAAWRLFGNPFRGRELHLHRLTPARVRRFAEDTPLRHVRSEFTWLLTPQFLSLFERA